MSIDTHLEAERAPLLEAMQAYLQIDHAPFYMPGHKRGQSIEQELQELLGKNLFYLDLPELPGLDEALIEAEELAAVAYGSDRSWFLVNGSTSGIAAMLLGVLSPGAKVLVGRNCHKATLAALVLSGAVPIYLATDYDANLDLDCGVSAQTLASSLAIHADAKAVIVVSPNYYGICGELDKLAAIAHDYQIPLLVDAAHGAHLGFHAELPQSALQAGADLVVHSTHKMLSGLTQASMLHCQGHLVDPAKINQAVRLLQSTSPNLMLLVSLDVARRQIALRGQELLSNTLKLATEARSQLAEIADLYCLDTAAIPTLDPTRLTVMVDGLGMTGFAADAALYSHLQVMAEMPTLRHLVFILSIGTTQADIERLIKGFQNLRSLGNELCPERFQKEASELLNSKTQSLYLSQPVQKLTPREAFFASSDRIAFGDAIGEISAEIICPYPPGIPAICPGEVITTEIVEFLKCIKTAGGSISGCSDSSLATIKVVR